MSELFDNYRSNYRDVVQSSIDFSGLSYSFFMRAKADLLRELIAQRLGPRKPPARWSVARQAAFIRCCAGNGRPPERASTFPRPASR